MVLAAWKWQLSGDQYLLSHWTAGLWASILIDRQDCFQGIPFDCPILRYSVLEGRFRQVFTLHYRQNTINCFAGTQKFPIALFWPDISKTYFNNWCCVMFVVMPLGALPMNTLNTHNTAATKQGHSDIWPNFIFLCSVYGGDNWIYDKYWFWDSIIRIMYRMRCTRCLLHNVHFVLLFVVYCLLTHCVQVYANTFQEHSPSFTM